MVKISKYSWIENNSQKKTKIVYDEDIPSLTGNEILKQTASERARKRKKKKIVQNWSIEKIKSRKRRDTKIVLSVWLS